MVNVRRVHSLMTYGTTVTLLGDELVELSRFESILGCLLRCYTTPFLIVRPLPDLGWSTYRAPCHSVLRVNFTEVVERGNRLHILVLTYSSARVITSGSSFNAPMPMLQ